MFTFLALALGTFALAEACLCSQKTRRQRGLLFFVGILGALLTLTLIALEGRPTHTLATLAMPAGLLWFAGLCTLAIAAARRRQRLFTYVLVAWLGYTLCGNILVGNLLIAPAEQAFGDVDPFSSHYDAVVVLGGGTASRGTYNFLGHSGDRIALGARLWHTGHTPLLITTGSTPVGVTNPHDSARATTQIWAQLGVDPSDIIAISHPTNTREEIAAIAALKRRRGWSRLGVVSSARHLPRVMRNARRIGLHILPLPADYRGSTVRFPLSLESVVPSGPGFMRVHTACWSWLARAAGH